MTDLYAMPPAQREAFAHSVAASARADRAAAIESLYHAARTCEAILRDRGDKRADDIAAALADYEANR